MKEPEVHFDNLKVTLNFLTGKIGKGEKQFEDLAE
jgi:hypothetical protein